MTCSRSTVACTPEKSPCNWVWQQCVQGLCLSYTLSTHQRACKRALYGFMFNKHFIFLKSLFSWRPISNLFSYWKLKLSAEYESISVDLCLLSMLLSFNVNLSDGVDEWLEWLFLIYFHTTEEIQRVNVQKLALRGHFISWSFQINWL